MKKICWLDVETTGLDPKANDVIQFALLIEINYEIVAQHEWRIQPFDWETIQQEALETHGFTVEDLQGFQPPGEAHTEIETFLSQYVDRYNRNDKLLPAGQNCRFDIDFLQHFFQKNGNKYFGSYFTWFPLDTITLAQYHAWRTGDAPDNFRLETIASHFQVPIPEDLHDALADITLTRKVFYAISACCSVRKVGDRAAADLEERAVIDLEPSHTNE